MSSNARQPIAKFNMELFKDCKPSLRQGKSQTELQPFHVNQVHARKLELESRSSHGREDLHYAELMQQLGSLKQELSKLKLDVSSVVESKAKAEKDIEFYSQKSKASLKKMEELRKEIEEANEEHVLVELARIEAEKELKEIESRRAAEAMMFSKNMEKVKKRIMEVRSESGRAKELEEKLAATNTDVSVLQNEMELLRAMENNFHREFLKVNEKNDEEEQLRAVEDELIKAKRGLECIKDEGFQFMASMDLIREELLVVSNETVRMLKLEKHAKSTIEHLNSKLMEAKSKLEHANSTEERTRGIVINLSTALQKLQLEVETAKEENDRAIKETNDIKLEVRKTGIDIESKEKKLQGAISTLGAVKASEFDSLVKLKSTMEKMVKCRALESQNSTMISISNWEYEYLVNKGEPAQEVADKKVEAINGWIEAIMAQEKEILLKTEVIEKEIKGMKDAEEKSCNTEIAVFVQKAHEFTNMLSTSVKLTAENSQSASRRSSKVRRTSTMAGMKNASRSPSFTIRKKKRVMPSLGTILGARSGKNKRNEVDIGSYATLLLAPENDYRLSD